MAATFRFSSADHTYRLGDRVVPAISTIVRWVHDASGPWLTEESRARGKAVHAATLELDLGAATADVLQARLAPEWRAFFYAYVQFRESCACRWQQLEQPAVHRRLLFAGTPDRVGTVNDFPALLELKTGTPAAWHPLQTAGQDILLGRRHGALRRFVVYLRSDGTFRLQRHEDPVDYLRFFAALQSYHDAHGGNRPLRSERAIRLRPDTSTLSGD